MKLRVTPRLFKIKKLSSIDRGIAIPTNKALRRPKKKVSTSTTRMIPKMMEFSSSPT